MKRVLGQLSFMGMLACALGSARPVVEDDTRATGGYTVPRLNTGEGRRMFDNDPRPTGEMPGAPKKGKGLTLFTVGDKQVWALNRANTERKAAQ